MANGGLQTRRKFLSGKDRAILRVQLLQHFNGTSGITVIPDRVQAGDCKTGSVDISDRRHDSN